MADVIDRNEGTAPGTLDLRGKRFYRPRVLFLYSVLANFPIAVFLYGINVGRRGSVVGGAVVRAVAVVMMVMLTAIAGLGTQVRALHLIGIGVAVGIGLVQAERSHYEDCIARGASRARWWPPLLFLAAQAAVVYLVAAGHVR